MISLDHLQVYDLTLTTTGLLHVGSGETLSKREYLYDPQKNTVSILKEQDFLKFLIRWKLVDQFESFCMGGGTDLRRFLYQDCGLTDRFIQPLIRYTLDADDALDGKHTLKDINIFVRNPQGEAYLPGSSVKGALRSVLLFRKISAQEGRAFRSSRDNKIPEENYLNTLNLVNERRNALNSIMRGVQVSDSEPVSDSAFTLSAKRDGFSSGGVGYINLCRECVRPGTQISLRITLDQSVLKGEITAESILEAIQAFGRYYQNTYASHFTPPRHSIQPSYQRTLFLGGGAGFWTKSLVYPYLGQREGLKFTAGKFHHEKDMDLGISPHTMKYGRYRGTLYQFGACEVSIR